MEEKKLYLLTYDHGGYVLWKDEVKPRLKDIAEWMEKYPKLKIGLDYESFTFDEFSRCDPEVVEMIKDLLEKYPDRVGLGATTYGQPLSLTISEESNARQLTYAIRTNLEYFGKTPSVYAISEYALNNQTPQLLSLCGYEASIFRSHVMGYGYPRTFDSAWGRWIGKDGTAIPSVPTYDKEGRGFNCTTLDNWILSRWPSDNETVQSIEEFSEMFSKYSPLLLSRYDDLTQPIEEFTKLTETKDNCQYILLEEIPGIYGKAEDELKTTDNDFHIQMPWGYCGNEIFNGVRACEVAAVQAEKLNALATLLGGCSYKEKLDEAWKYALAAQHHDVTICGLLDLSRRFIPSSLNASEEVKENVLSYLEENFADSEYRSVLLLNLQSFEVDEWFEIRTEENSSIYDGDTLLESESVGCDDGYILKFHAKLPSFTVKRFLLKKRVDEENKCLYSWDEENGVLSTPLYSIRLNESGVVYIDDIKNNCRLVDNGEGALFTACVEDINCKSEGDWTVKTSSYGAVAINNGKIGTIPYRFEMRFNSEQARIDCKTRFELHGEHVGRTGIDNGLKKSLTVDGHRHEEKLNFILNVCLENGRKMFRDLPYSISDWNGAVRKTEDYWYDKDYILVDTEVSEEESFNSTTYMEGIYSIGLRDAQKGIAVFNRGCMGSLIQGNHVEVPLLYSNSYMCGTRILEGIFEDEFALYPFDSSVKTADVFRCAYSYNYPPMAKLLQRGNSNLSEYRIADFDAENGEVVLTSMYQENNYILSRFCNYSDEKSTVKFLLADGDVVSQSDLLGNDILEINGDAIQLNPWEIKTVKIKVTNNE